MLESPVPSIPQRPKTRPKKSEDAVSAESGNSSASIPTIPQRPRKTDTLSSLESVNSEEKKEAAVPVIPSRPRKEKSESSETESVEPKLPSIPRRPRKEKSEEPKVGEDAGAKEIEELEPVKDEAAEEPLDLSKSGSGDVGSSAFGSDTVELEPKQIDSKVDDSKVVDAPTLPLNDKADVDEEISKPESPETDKIVPSEPQEDEDLEPEEAATTEPVSSGNVAQSDSSSDLAEAVGSKIKEQRELASELVESNVESLQVESSEGALVDEIDSGSLRNEHVNEVSDAAFAKDNLTLRALDEKKAEEAKETKETKSEEEPASEGISGVDDEKPEIEEVSQIAEPSEAKELDLPSKDSEEPADLDAPKEAVSAKPKQDAAPLKEDILFPEGDAKDDVPEDAPEDAPEDNASKDDVPKEDAPKEETPEEKAIAKDGEDESPVPKMPIIPLRPSKPKRLDSSVSELDSKSSPAIPSRPAKPATKEKPKAPPPKPKKLSSKIAAFQQMFNQEPTEAAKEEKSSPEKRGKLSSEKTNFAANLQNMMGAGIALPGMANPELLKKLAPAELESEPSEKKSDEAPQPTSRRAKGPRGKRLPKSIQETKITIEPRFKFSSGLLWELDFSKPSAEESTEGVTEPKEDIKEELLAASQEPLTGAPLDSEDSLKKDVEEPETTKETKEFSIPIGESSAEQPESVEDLPSLQETQPAIDDKEELLKIEHATQAPLDALEEGKTTTKDALSEAEPGYEIISREKDQVETPRANTSEEFDDDSGFEEAREVFSSPKPLGDFTKDPEQFLQSEEDPTVEVEQQLKELSDYVRKHDDEPVLVSKAEEEEAVADEADAEKAVADKAE
ncbi:hypothetical protein C7M61_003759 [Candidozyma pseudohaemuli]|uniref:Altered inheritance of mitochondria protein 21 n=1 Tax=Candidozyma pseudohaemuli TaxID=418784 RepID=A0A2P7YLS8_9ASCO|nr:hypothetical protein C7M61_003759 [[Candida] pseudohaemulonii]PSK36895.1 hypothetical protein C7M61_003759 [[Candida] pseudohaemulonii]